METITIQYPTKHVAIIYLNRERKFNAMSIQMFKDLKQSLDDLSSNGEIRAVLIQGSGQHFSSGLDLSDMNQIGDGVQSADPARKALKTYEFLKMLQECVSSIEECSKPVIAVIHGCCFGAGVALTSACDIRYASQDAVLSIKEIDIAMTADLGTLQRFPKIVANIPWTRELVYTGRQFNAKEASAFGFVSRIYENKVKTVEAAMELASVISEKSPVAIAGCKRNLIYSRDHSVEEGLEFAAQWSSWALQCPDIANTVTAKLKKEKPVYPKL